MELPVEEELLLVSIELELLVVSVEQPLVVELFVHDALFVPNEKLAWVDFSLAEALLGDVEF
jgi:hypothetical protein